MIRAAKISFKVNSGQSVLERGHETAKRLWNYMWWCCFGYNEKLVREREGKVRLQAKNGKFFDGIDWALLKQKGVMPYQRGEGYPGEFGMAKELRSHWTAQDLSDRCFSNTIKLFDGAVKSWFSNLKENPAARPPGPSRKSRQLMFEVGRNAKHLGSGRFKLTVLGGAIAKRHAEVELRGRPGLDWNKIKTILLFPDGSGHVTINSETIHSSLPGEGVAALDMGIINLGCLAFENGTSVLYSGRAILADNQWAQKQEAACKPSGWFKGQKTEKRSETSKAYHNKSTRQRDLTLHNFTRHIINACLENKVGVLVMGDLTGIRGERGKKGKDMGDRTNQKLHVWPFAKIVALLTYKAEEVGITIVKRNERGTSSTHHVTGQKGVRSPRGLVRFGAEVFNSDVNGAFGILNNYLVEIGKERIKARTNHPTFIARFETNKQIKVSPVR